MSAKSSIRCYAGIAPGWDQETGVALAKLVCDGAGKQLPVVFDFDNTIVRGDIGEATLAVLARSGLLTPASLSPWICPPLRRPGKPLLELQSCADVTEYYSALLAPTVHGREDPSPLSSGYAWAVEVMSGLRLSDVIQATRTAYALSRPEKPGIIEVTPGKTSFPAPSFYPEMVELLAELVRQEFDVWIVSASNVWSVRWMVLQALNPLLRERKVSRGIRADHVIGISTLLADVRDGWLKDSILVKENPDYASLSGKAISGLRLTSRLQFPLPAYSGKVACILDAIGRRPYLGVGDGPGDRAMLASSEHQLWIARHPEDVQRVTATLLRSGGKPDWLTHAGRGATLPGLPERVVQLPARSSAIRRKVRRPNVRSG
jgi:hypothetical protein